MFLTKNQLKAFMRLYSLPTRKFRYDSNVLFTTILLLLMGISNLMNAQTTYTVTNTNDAGAGSLRQAITDANANLGADIINFSIGAGGLQTITPLSALPTISEAVTINATTQTGYAGSPLIEINGTSAGVGTTCFNVTGGNTTIKGFVINRFSGNGITLVTGNGNTVAGNYIGSNSAGTAILGAMAENIQVRSANNTIGGIATADRNIIVGGTEGIRIYGATATGNTIINNCIGTGINGTEVLGNTDDGIDIGTSAANNTIGGISSFNKICNNGGDGIEFRSDAGVGNVILGNSIFSNVGNGIDFNQDGITANDVGDADTGPNGLQNYPVLTTVACSTAGTTFVGTLNSNINTTYRIEFFSNKPAIADVNGEGQTFLGYVEVTTNASGNASFNTTLTGILVNAGDKISATATIKTGVSSYSSTSEFSANVTASSTLAPGGVATNLAIWLKANAGVSSGATFSWIDQSSNGRTAIQGTGANQPVFSTVSMNYNPAITFDGINDVLTIANSAGLPSGAGQVHGFGVAKNTNVTAAYKTVFSYGVSSTNSVFSLNKYAFDANAYVATNSTDVLSSSLEFANNSTVLFDGKYTGTQGVLSSFGKQRATASFVHNLTAANGTVGAWLGGVDAWWNGDISEVILYSSNLTALEAQRVNSYLALKYGITLDQSPALNYIASDGTIFWDATTNSTYKNNIAGIARDDASGLRQKQAKSANAGFQLTMGLSSLIATDNDSHIGNFSGDKAALLWGDNGASVSAWTATGAPANRLILARTWKTQQTGTTGNLKLRVPDNSGVNGLPNENSTVYLLIDTDGNFASGATEYAMTLNGTDWEINYNFTTNLYFTFATQSVAISPGGVTGTAIWLKADAGVTTGATFTWADQSGNNRNSTQATAANQPVYTSSSFNYNPAVTFDGTNDYLSIANLAGLPTGAAQVEEFGVANNTNVAGGWQHILNYGNGVAYQAFGLSKNQLNGNAVAMGFYVDAISNAQEFAGGLPVLLDGKYTGTQLVISSFGTQKATTAASLNLGTSVGYVGVDPVIANTTHWTGGIQEVVLYGTNLTSTQAQRVNSYLALKYGITLDQSSPISYLASDGTTLFWDATTYSIHKYNIAGIARDDVSGLSQKQSKSINSGFQVAIGNGNTIAATNAANTNNFSADKSALVWGDNSASVVVWTSTGAPVSRQILARVWRLQETGTVGSVKVQVPDNSGVNGLPAENTTVYLLVDADGNFTAGATEIAMTLNGTNWEANVDFTNGQFFTFATQTPTGPGGVYTSNVLWLKANANVTVSGANVTAWGDASAAGMNATAFNNPTLVTANHNFNPTISFNGTNNYFDVADGFADFTAGASGFVIARPTANKSYARFIDFGLGEANNNLNFRRIGTSDDLGYEAVNGTTLSGISAASQITNNAVMGYSFVQAGTTANLYKNGLNLTSGTVLSLNNVTRTLNYIGRSNWAADEYYQGDMAEVILFNRNLTTTERQRIDAYLALKFGYTLDQTAPTNYVFSDGTVMWNASTNSTHKNNIAGIARDDVSVLNQKQSKSINTGLQVAIGHGNTIATDNISNTNNFASDKTAFVWGDNGAAASAWTSVGAPANRVILPRVWKVQKTGTTSLMKFQIADNSVPNGLPAEGTSVYLLMDADGDFSSGASSAMMSLVGGNWECGANFSSGYYFTFATEQTAEAGTFAAVSSCIDVKTTIAPTHNNNHNATNTQRYVLCNAQGIIMQVNTTPSFSTCGIGDFTVYAINYPTNGVTNLTVGTDITALTGSPTNYDVEPLGITVCKTICGKYNSIIPQ